MDKWLCCWFYAILLKAIGIKFFGDLWSVHSKEQYHFYSQYPILKWVRVFSWEVVDALKFKLKIETQADTS
jgi:hypothetical protein